MFRRKCFAIIFKGFRVHEEFLEYLFLHESDMFLRKVGNHLASLLTSHTRRPESATPIELLWKPQNSHPQIYVRLEFVNWSFQDYVWSSLRSADNYCEMYGIATLQEQSHYRP